MYLTICRADAARKNRYSQFPATHIACCCALLVCVCSLQLRPSAWKGTELAARAPHRHNMPLSSEAPGVQVLQDLPPIGTALPVVIDPGAVPSTGLPQVGDWVKIKVVGVAAVQVRIRRGAGSQRGSGASPPVACLSCLGAWCGVCGPGPSACVHVPRTRGPAVQSRHACVLAAPTPAFAAPPAPDVRASGRSCLASPAA